MIESGMMYAFENDVKMYGTQAISCLCLLKHGFENDVKMYGTQADLDVLLIQHQFENDVNVWYSSSGSMPSNFLIV